MQHKKSGWREVVVRTTPEHAKLMHDTYLVVMGHKDRARPVLLSDPEDVETLMFDILDGQEQAQVQIRGTHEEAAEYALARGYAALQIRNDAQATKPDDVTTALARETEGRSPEEAIVRIPARMQLMVVTTNVFGKPIQAVVTAGSNVGALMMTAHRAAAEALSNPYSEIRAGTRRTEALPLHPNILDGARLCYDPVRNTPSEPWTWGPQSIDEAEVEATELRWYDGGMNPELRGWYIAVRNSDGEAVELSGPIAHDGRAVLTKLCDTFPGLHDPDEKEKKPRRRAAVLACTRLEDALGKARAEGTEQAEPAVMQKELLALLYTQRANEPPDGPKDNREDAAGG